MTDALSSTDFAPERSADRTVDLQSGRLQLWVDQSDLPLGDLCGFASRANAKRGFLFVSRVLGKHLPVRPAVMDDVHRRLAAKLPTDLPGPVTVVAMAETATGLGQSVFERYLRQSGRDDLLFSHSTRYRLGTALDFREPHSHATDHLLHLPPDPATQRRFEATRTLVLVDDEISTGTTLANLARVCRGVQPALERVVIVSLKDWLAPQRRTDSATRSDLPTDFVSLLRGHFRFTPDPDFRPPPVDVAGSAEPKNAYLPHNFGRLGVCGLPDLDLDRHLASLDLANLAPGSRLLVLGTGEFAYPPYKLARALEAAGHDVWFQTTTRSPILLGGAIGSALSFTDNYFDNIPNFVYNVDPAAYDQILVGYETPRLPPDHTLCARLGAHPCFF